jgi:hypothetical protein
MGLQYGVPTFWMTIRFVIKSTFFSGPPSRFHSKVVWVAMSLLVFRMFYYTTQHYFFRELNSTIFHRFLAVNYEFVLIVFSQHVRFLRKSSMNLRKALKMLYMSDSKKIQNNISLKSKVYVVSLVIKEVCKTGFGIFLAHLVRLKSEK